MKKRMFAIASVLIYTATAFAGLDTATYVGYGIGSTIDDAGNEQAYAPGGIGGLPNSAPFTGDLPVTLKDTSGGDLWNGGDDFMYLHDDDQYTESFTAQVRVISQTAAVDGRWGKAGIHARTTLNRDAANATAMIASGNGSQATAPSSGADHSPVPVRLSGRDFEADDQSGYEQNILHDPASTLLADIDGNVANDFFKESAAGGVLTESGATAVWLSLEYNATFGEFIAGVADDVNGAPGVWNFSDPRIIDADADGYYVGLAYSTHGDFQQHFEYPEWFHGVTYDNYTITPDTTGGDPDGDFNNDSNYDCADIDALTAEVAALSNDTDFDLTGDGMVNGDDITSWLAEAGEANIGAGRTYLPGDGNLDGVVDVSDFGIWNSAKFTNNDAWCSGDFTADGVVDVSDFGVWNSNKFQASDAAGVSAVPEPSALALLLPGLMLFALRFRRR